MLHQVDPPVRELPGLGRGRRSPAARRGCSSRPPVSSLSGLDPTSADATSATLQSDSSVSAPVLPAPFRVQDVRVPTGVHVQLLGRFQVRRDGEEMPPAAFGGRKVRTLLRVLAVRRPDLVPHDVLADALWPDRLPADPAGNLGVLVNRARRALGDPRVDRHRYRWVRARCVRGRRRRVPRGGGAGPCGPGGPRRRAAGVRRGARALGRAAGRGHLRRVGTGRAGAAAPRPRRGVRAGRGRGGARLGVPGARWRGRRRRRRRTRCAESAVLAVARALAAAVTRRARWPGSRSCAAAGRRARRRPVAVRRAAAARVAPRGGRRSTGSRVPTAAVGELGFVGRGVELDRMRVAVAARGLVLLGGVAGAGKSRLLAELARVCPVPVSRRRAFLPERAEAWGLARTVLREGARRRPPRACLRGPRRARGGAARARRSARRPWTPRATAPWCSPVACGCWRRDGRGCAARRRRRAVGRSQQPRPARVGAGPAAAAGRRARVPHRGAVGRRPGRAARRARHRGDRAGAAVGRPRLRRCRARSRPRGGHRPRRSRSPRCCASWRRGAASSSPRRTAVGGPDRRRARGGGGAGSGGAAQRDPARAARQSGLCAEVLGLLALLAREAPAQTLATAAGAEAAGRPGGAVRADRRAGSSGWGSGAGRRRTTWWPRRSRPRSPWGSAAGCTGAARAVEAEDADPSETARHHRAAGDVGAAARAYLGPRRRWPGTHGRGRGAGVGGPGADSRCDGGLGAGPVRGGVEARSGRGPDVDIGAPGTAPR